MNCASARITVHSSCPRFIRYKRFTTYKGESESLPLRRREDFLAEEGDEVAEQLFLADGIVLVVADGVTTDGYQLGNLNSVTIDRFKYSIIQTEVIGGYGT